MTPSQRVITNTIAQYLRTIITMLLSLFTVRVVLSSLGQNDFGIYSLVAGCVSMLGFVTNSLIRTTQRFVNYYQGKNDVDSLKNVFNNCLIVHFFIGIIVVLIFEVATPFFFGGFLNILEDRITAAKFVYQSTVAMLFMTITMSPFKALLVSHENIVYISAVEVLDSVVKVLLVVLMFFAPYDKLILYGIIMLTLQIVNFFAYSFFCYVKYDECVKPQIKGFNFVFFKELIGFAGWQIYGTACNIGRDQGTSIVLNRSYGTSINASWGLGVQLAGYSQVLSGAIVNAMSPQIIKSEGAGDRQRTLRLSNILSKLQFFLISIVGLPVFFEAPKILQLWLGEYPDYTVFFCRMFIAAFIVDAMSIGITHVNNAIGNIKKYTIVMNTPKFLMLFIVILILYNGCSVIWIGYLYVAIEFVCAMIRVPLIKEQAGLDVKDFYVNVILKELLPFCICVGACSIIIYTLPESMSRLLLTIVTTIIIYSFSVYYYGLTKREKDIIINIKNTAGIRIHNLFLKQKTIR